MLEAVPSSIKNRSHRRRKYCARTLNCLLLFLIFYGATCGLIHSHTVYLPSIPTLAAATLDDARQTGSAARLLPSGKDCLLCQFHQQLSHGLFHTAPFAPPSRASAALRPDSHSDSFSVPHESSRGRAPPSASLL
jgi:hypothetical protein